MHSVEWAVYNVYKHSVLRLRSTDWKSSLMWFDNRDFYLPIPHRKKKTGKVFSLTFQTNTNLHNYVPRWVCSEKSVFDEHVAIIFLPQKTPETNEFMTIASEEVNKILFITVHTFHGWRFKNYAVHGYLQYGGYFPTNDVILARSDTFFCFELSTSIKPKENIFYTVTQKKNNMCNIFVY